MASQTAPETVAEARKVPRSMRVDPSRRPVPDEVPQSMLDRWQEMLDEAEANRKNTVDQITVHRITVQRYADDLRKLVHDAYFMHLDLDGLAYLFDKALVDDAEGDTDLLKASHLVVDVMRTIAARLRALDEQAALAYQKANP
ncbi:hypothetical protein [Methylobacterium sp. sgz302541]|uniref:hypothetical protein n=1 Tax=unclassified Methylobacterium TaxID=2615210 RepID=UPI003D34EBB1